jgi:nitroreductase family protein
MDGARSALLRPESRSVNDGMQAAMRPVRKIDIPVTTMVEECLTAAIAAPSIHNTQPWLFRPFAGGVDVFADQHRRLDVIDPKGRELLISVGCALLNLRIAILAHGRTPLQEILPDPARPSLAARVRIGPSTHVSDTVRLLADAIPRRHTIRRPFTSDAVPKEVLREMSQAASAEGGTLRLAQDASRDAILGLVRLAEHSARHDPRYWRELAEWTQPSRQRKDGVPPAAFGPWSAMESIPLRDFGLVHPVHGRGVAWFEENPTIAILSTDGDAPADWLRAGEALERVLLTAAVRGLATTLMTQPLELPTLRRMLDESAVGGTAQAVIRFGYGPIGTATPRRGLDEVLISVPPH